MRVRIAVQVSYILIKVAYLLERCGVSAPLLGSAFFSPSVSWSTFCEMIQNKNNKKLYREKRFSFKMLFTLKVKFLLVLQIVHGF